MFDTKIFKSVYLIPGVFRDSKGALDELLIVLHQPARGYHLLSVHVHRVHDISKPRAPRVTPWGSPQLFYRLRQHEGLLLIDITPAVVCPEWRFKTPQQWNSVVELVSAERRHLIAEYVQQLNRRP